MREFGKAIALASGVLLATISHSSAQDIERISVNHLSGDAANFNSSTSRSVVNHFSADGRYVVFSSSATNLVSGIDPNSSDDVFVYARDTGTTERVSDLPGFPGGSDPSISADGRYVAFTSLVPFNGIDIYVTTETRARRSN